MRRHVIIAGTGRAGTSFLVQLLTRLGLDTGFTLDNLDQNLDPIGRAGLESNIRDENAAYIVKSPNISNYIEEILENPEIKLDLVIIPIRDIEKATESRVKVSKDNLKRKGILTRIFGSKRGHAGGMIKTSNPDKQQFILLKSLSHVLVECARHDQAIALLHYPKLMDEPTYLYRKLQPILGEISEETFVAAHKEMLRPDWVTRK
ncbi:MAG: hypothetical protein K9G41_08965 [Flavobacteriales bacterium]|nr:hypothetical protein [Flavobacteriales bacterium]